MQTDLYEEKQVYTYNNPVSVSVGVRMNLQGPTLGQVNLVSQFIEDNGLVTEKLLKSKFKEKIKGSTISQILFYLERERLIYRGKKGINWILNENPKFKKLLEKTIKVR